MDKEYDLIVIGTGSAGSTAAYKCKSKEWSVAIIDSLPFGGTCALRGCDPKKILVGAAEISDRSLDIKGNGIEKEPKIKWSDLMEFKKSFIEPRPKQREQGFQNVGIDTYHGRARFTEKNKIQVGDDTLKGKYILIATGATPVKLNILGEKYISNSDDFLEMNKMPKKITFIGGGYISFELAHVAARAGAKVEILHRSENLLKNFDSDLVEMLVKSYKESDINVYINMFVNSIEKKGKKLIVYTGKDKKNKFETDMVVHGAGRVPDIENLDLHKAGVETDKKGIVVNEYLQSVSNPAIYVAGDANSRGIPLSPVAGYDGKIVAQNILNGNTDKPDYTAIPSVAFSYPILSSVGIRGDEAKDKGFDYKVNNLETSSWYTSKRIGLKYSGSKILVDNKTDQILGAHILGYNADELINLFVMAMKFGIKSEELKKIIFAYPTGASDIKYMV